MNVSACMCICMYVLFSFYLICKIWHADLLLIETDFCAKSKFFLELPAYTMNAKFMEHWINGNLLSCLLWLLETAFIKLNKWKFCNFSDFRSWFCTSIWFHRPYSLILILIYVDHLDHFHRDSTKLGVLNLLIYIYWI